MKKLWQRLRQWASGHFRPLEISSGEAFFLRLGLTLIVLWTLRDSRPFEYTETPDPRGLARIFPLGWLAMEKVRWVVIGLIGTGLLAYLANLGRRWGLLLAALLHIFVFTNFNSQGFVHHGYQIVSLVLLAQTILLFVQHRRRRSGSSPSRAFERGEMLYYSQGIVAGTYVVAALTKFFNTKGLWIWHSKYLAADIVKSHQQVYYKYLDPNAVGDLSVANWLNQNPFAAQLMFGSGFVLEAVALLALRNRPWALFLGISLIAMHRAIYAIMRLDFPYNELLLLVFFVNLPGWIFLWLARRKVA